MTNKTTTPCPECAQRDRDEAALAFCKKQQQIVCDGLLAIRNSDLDYDGRMAACDKLIEDNRIAYNTFFDNMYNEIRKQYGAK